MPDREGLETIQAIRQNWPHLPVIAMSGVMGGAYLGLAQKLGATGVLRKPFGGAELLSEILRLMERSPDGATRH